MAGLEWNGDATIERVRAAAAAAVDDVVDETRDDARVTHPWREDPKPRTLKSGRRVNTHLERTIQSEHAAADDPNPTGRVGYTRRAGFVGLFHEEGTVHEHAYPTLRPAADRHFPTLAERIAERLK
jgi:hypothetical protein